MNRASRFAYILAKIYGELAKTYVGSTFQDLLRLKNLQEIFDTLFPGQRSAVSEDAIPAELDARIVKASISSMMSILKLMRDPPEVLVHILRRYEYQGLKSVIRSLSQGGAEAPVVWDIGPYAQIDLRAGRDYEKAIAASRFAWILPHLQSSKLFEAENALDRDYFSNLLRLARGLPRKDRSGVERLVRLEISLASAVWALRLRFFFGLDAKAAQPLLAQGVTESHRKAMTDVFEIPADSNEGWKKWKYAWLIDDQLGESFRGPDPIRAEHKAARRLALRAHQLIHEDPFTLTPVAAFFKLKELEEGMLKIAVEARRLSVPENEVLAMVGAG